MAKNPPPEDLPQQLRDTVVIGESVTLTAFRRIVAQRMPKLDPPGDEYQAELTIIYDDDKEQWYVFALRLDFDYEKPRHLLYAIAPRGRATPFITRRRGQRGYRTLDTLIRQMTDIFGERTILNARFNTERRYDLMTKPDDVAP